MQSIIYLIIHILFVLGIFLTIKLTDYFKQNKFHVMSINYIIATVFSFYNLVDSHDANLLIIDKSLLFTSLVIGSLFILNFVLMFYSTQKVGIGITTVLNKTALIIPVAVGFFFLGQRDDLIEKLIGLVICLISFIFIFYKRDKKRATAALLLPLSVFFASGITDSAMEVTNKYLLNTEQTKEIFLFFVFFTAFLLSILLVYIDKRRGGKFKSSVLIFGFGLGIFNYLGSKMLLINVERLGGSVVFPILNASLVILTALIGMIFFKEKFSSKQWIGILLAVFAVSIIASTL